MQNSQGQILALASSKYVRGTARAEDAQGTPTQNHISPSILVYEGNTVEVVLKELCANGFEPVGPLGPCFKLEPITD